MIMADHPRTPPHVAELVKQWRHEALVAGQYSVECAINQPHAHHVAASEAMTLARCADELEAVAAALVSAVQQLSRGELIDIENLCLRRARDAEGSSKFDEGKWFRSPLTVGEGHTRER